MVAGNVADLGIGVQSAKGTALANSQERVYLTGGGVETMRTVSVLDETSSGRTPNNSVVNMVGANGSIPMYARPDSLGIFLYGAFGAVAHTGAGDPWTHTYTFALTQPWLTLWKNIGGLLFERYIDNKIGDLELISEKGQPLRVTAPILGLSPRYLGTAESGSPAAADNAAPFMHYDGKGALKLETVAIASIERIRILIPSGLVAQQGDDVEGSDVTEGQRRATIETVNIITDLAQYNRFHYGTATPSAGDPPTKNVVELAGTGVDYKWTRVAAATPPERSLQITATRLQIASVSGFTPTPNGDALKQTVIYNVFQPSGGGSAMTAILKNGKATH